MAKRLPKSFDRQKIFKKLFKYKDGKLFHKARLNKHSWNNRFAGKEAGSLKPMSNKATPACQLEIGMTIEGTFYKEYANRVIWSMFNGNIPKGYAIARHNHDYLDNRIENLHCIPEKLASKNRKIHKRIEGDVRAPACKQSSCSGVSYHRKYKQWQARIMYKKIGWFDTEREAVIARKQAEEEEGFHINHGVALV